MTSAGAFLNEGIIRSGYSSAVDVFDHSSLGRLTNCLLPFNYPGEDAYADDGSLVGCCCYGPADEGGKISIGTGSYPPPMMMELFDHHSSFCDDSFLDLNVFDSDFCHEPETTEVEGHAPMTSSSSLSPPSNPYHPSPSSSSSASLPHSSFPSPPPDINAFLLYPDEEEEEEEDVYSSSQEEAILRNIPIFVATGRVSEDERNDDDDDDNDYARKTYSSGLGAKVKVENEARSYNRRTTIPRTIVDAIDSSTAAPKRVRRRKDQLWYFLLEILGDPECNPNYIQWENKDQGIFRFIESKKVAQLWGEKKKRSGMSYEYFARAMRHYYSRGIMRRVTGRRLVYQFGPKAENWRGYAQQVTVDQSKTLPPASAPASAPAVNDPAKTGRGCCC